MFCVFWMHDGVAHSCVFHAMGEALNHANELRNNNMRFVTMSSEVPGNTTLMGVSAPSPDYNWKKRR